MHYCNSQQDCARRTCSAGKYRSGSCRDCPAGQYYGSSGFQTSCGSCSSGQYASSSGSTSCRSCSSGQTSSSGATSCYSSPSPPSTRRRSSSYTTDSPPPPPPPPPPPSSDGRKGNAYIGILVAVSVVAVIAGVVCYFACNNADKSNNTPTQVHVRVPKPTSYRNRPLCLFICLCTPDNPR